MEVAVASTSVFAASNIRHNKQVAISPSSLLKLSNTRHLKLQGLKPFQSGGGLVQRLGPSNGSRLICGTWLHNSAKVEVDVPLSDAWDLWSDREKIIQWMPWIASVEVQKDKPELSKWTLRYEAFGQNLEFSWLARNLQPIFHQKIHWRSVNGLPNSGAVRFYPRGPLACSIELTISYEVPDVLAGVASALGPLVGNILMSDLERFAKIAKTVKA